MAHVWLVLKIVYHANTDMIFRLINSFNFAENAFFLIERGKVEYVFYAHKFNAYNVNQIIYHTASLAIVDFHLIQQATV